MLRFAFTEQALGAASPPSLSCSNSAQPLSPTLPAWRSISGPMLRACRSRAVSRWNAAYAAIAAYTPGLNTPFANIASRRHETILTLPRPIKEVPDERPENHCPPGSGLDRVARRSNCAGVLVHIKILPFLMRFSGSWCPIPIVVLALGAAALRSDWRDRRLLGALFFIPAAIETVNLIEGVIFLTNVNMDWRGMLHLPHSVVCRGRVALAVRLPFCSGAGIAG